MSTTLSALFQRIQFFALVIALLALAACGQRLPAPSNETPVFLISIDTLRSDRLPAYGYAAIATPAIDAFRRDSVLFEKAFSHCPLTFPSHATVLTGRLPADAGVRDNAGYQLDARVPTLGELLRGNGYATGAAISSFVLRKNTKIDRGFDAYDDDIEQASAAMNIGRIQRPGRETVSVAKKWLAENTTKPVFYFLHLYEPHTPYEPPEPFKSRYTSAYDAEIAYVDQVLGEFLSFLKERDLYDRSLIVLFSDHGEGLGDHGEEEHGILLYRETIQVPLIVKLPAKRMAGRSVAAPVQLSDIFPTVTQQTATKRGPIDGSSLLDALTATRPQERFIYSETYYAKFHFGWSDLHSITDGRNHLIHGPKPELYDLEADPGERREVLDANRRTYLAMRRALNPLIREAEAPAAINSEEAAKLAALGYLGGGVKTAPGEVLPNPKDNIGAFKQIRQVFTLSRNNEVEPALALATQLLTHNPGMVDLWSLKARLLATQRKQREAIDAAKEGLRLASNASHLALLVATLSLELGELDQAAKHAELVFKTEPAQAHDVLARVWIARRDFDRAEKEARASLEAQTDRALALVTLARVEKERGNHEQALIHLDAAVASLKTRKTRTINNLHLLRGDVLARLGRNVEAEQAFREEIRLFPQEPRAYKNLILLYVAEGRTQEGTAVIHELVKTSPTPISYFAVIDVLKIVGDNRGARYWARRAQERFPNDRRFAAL